MRFAATPSLLARPATPALGPTPTLAQQHGALLRRLAHVQNQVGLLVVSNHKEGRYWQNQLLHQSTRLLLERSRADWGLVRGMPARPLVLPLAPVDDSAGAHSAARHTEALICRTGCAMDNDHWREGTQCRRTGTACHGLGVAAPSPEQTPDEHRLPPTRAQRHTQRSQPRAEPQPALSTADPSTQKPLPAAAFLKPGTIA